MTEVTLRVMASDFATDIAVLDQDHQVEWQRERLDSGAGQFTIPHDSPVVQANPSILDADNVVIVQLDGDDWFPWLIRRRSRKRGDVWDPITVTGPGAREVLRYGLVEPWQGFGGAVVSDDRVWGWMAPGFDRSSWLSSGNLFAGGTYANPAAPIASARCGDGECLPPGFPDPDAEWIWTRPTTGLFEHPVGTSLFAVEFDVDSYPGVDTPAALFVAGDGKHRTWLDGVEVASGDSWRQAQRVDIDLKAGVTHTLAFEVTNGPSRFDGNPGGLLFTVVRLDGDGELTRGIITRSERSGSYASSGDLRGLDYPDPVPGVTPGTILADVFDEWLDRGGIAALTRDFTSTHDSAGKPWPFTTEFAAQIGNDNVLSVGERLRDLDVDVDIEIIDGAFTFRAWYRRGANRYAGYYAPAGIATLPLDRVYDLDTETEDQKVNQMTVRNVDTWLYAPDPPVSSNRREMFLSLGLTPTEGAARQIGDKLVSDFNRPRQVIRCSAADDNLAAGSIPEYNFTVGDIVEGPYLDPSQLAAGDWDVGPSRVDTIRGKPGPTGVIEWTFELSPMLNPVPDTITETI